MNETEPINGRKAFLSAFVWTTLLSILLSPLLIVGPFLAGYVGGRKARSVGYALIAALIPAALWAFGMTWLVSHAVTIKGNAVTLGPPMNALALATWAAILSGALIASPGRRGKIAGTVLLAGGIFNFVPQMSQLYNSVRFLGDAAKVDTVEVVVNKTCPENLKSLYNAVKFYAEEWDDTLPPADHWATAIRDKITKDEWLHCPVVSTRTDEKYGYAMNPTLGGKRLSEIKDPANTPLFYDSSDLKLDAHDPPTQMPKPGRHGGADNLVTVSGDVKSVQP